MKNVNAIGTVIDPAQKRQLRKNELICNISPGMSHRTPLRVFPRISYNKYMHTCLSVDGYINVAKIAPGEPRHSATKQSSPQFPFRTLYTSVHFSFLFLPLSLSLFIIFFSLLSLLNVQLFFLSLATFSQSLFLPLSLYVPFSLSTPATFDICNVCVRVRTSPQAFAR